MRERACDIAGTRRNKANSISKSNVHIRKFQLVNLQNRKLWWEEGKHFIRIRISTRTLKTIKKFGLHATAKKYGVDLRPYIKVQDTPPGTIPIQKNNKYSGYSKKLSEQLVVPQQEEEVVMINKDIESN